MAVFCLITHGVNAEDLSKANPDKSLVYKRIGDRELKMHIFLPEGHKASDKRAAVVFFFGGGWVGGTPSQFYPHCRYLASRGMVAMAADYRVKSKDKTTPKECVMDGKSAVRWLRKNASQWGVDPDKVAAGGGSAGGHVAAATGTVKGFEEKGEDLSVSSKPVALVLFNPVYDNGPKGYGHNRVKDYWKQISPMHNLGEHSPPTIVFLGTKDNLIPVSTAKKYQQLMKKSGVRSDLHLYPGQPHGFFNLNKSRESFESTVAHMDKFFVSLGYLNKK
ncbi:MAG: alpha/beta hydrolase [Akkermansiaceae bacterium]